MRRSLMIPVALAALLTLSLSAPASLAVGPHEAPAPADEGRRKGAYQPRGDFAPGELLVKFRKGLARAQERAVHSTLSARVLDRIGGGLGIDHVRLPGGLSVADAIRRYEANPFVEFAEPNFYRYPAFTPNDPRYQDHSLWGLNNTGQPHPAGDSTSTFQGTDDADMDVPEAWDTETGDSGVVIAVIDSGVDVTHDDLDGNLWENPGETLNGVDDDGNAKIDDINGWDTAEEDATLLENPAGLENPALSGYDHGTHVAGTAAGETNNSTGVSGVCGGDGVATQAGCSIMVLKFMDAIDTGGSALPDTMAGLLSDELQAITYARRKGAHIINASFGGPSWSKSEREAIRLAGVNNDILFVAAAGNESLDNDLLPSYPASYNLSRILSVAASNHNDEYGYTTACVEEDFNDPWDCAFSNFGRYSVDVAAPGVDVLSTLPTDTYGTFNGTSMATPHAAGVAGLLLSQDPTRTALTVKNIIMATADTTESDGVTPLPVFSTMNTSFFEAVGGLADQFTGAFTRTRARINANDAVDFTGTPPNGSANHDGDIPGALGMSGTRASGSLAWPADSNDMRKKRLTRGRTYRITLVVPAGRDFDLLLWKSDTKEIWQPGKFIKGSFRGTGADESMTFKPGSTRTFFIHMNWFDGNQGNYTLKVVCILNC